MNGSVFDTPAFRPLPLMLCLSIAALIFAGWYGIDAMQPWWNLADDTVFRTLNNTLRERVWWQHIWAIGNNHFFDFLAIMLMLWLAFQYITAENRAYVHERIAVMLTIAVALAVALVFTDVMGLVNRASPTATLDNTVRLSESITWLETKDIAYSSYPSDHGTVLFMMTLALWFFAGRRIGIIMLTGAIFFIFPRLIGGAHWFSDIFGGSIPLALTVTGIMFFTPLHRIIMRGWLWLLNKPLIATCIAITTHDEAPSLLAKGCCMGASDIVPGVSGGTMAYILGIWHRLIEAVKSFDMAWFSLLMRGKFNVALTHAHFFFVVPLLFGIGLAVITFTKFIPIPQLLLSHPEPIYGLFFGLIAGSIVLLLQEMGKINGKEVLIVFAGIATGWLLVNVVPVNTPETWWFVYLCGCVAISAMLLPGISGSFILLILGKYAYILGGIGSLDMSIILPFMLGCFTGLIAFSRGASWLLAHYYRPSVLAITGILVGSLWMIWPFQERIYETIREKQRLVSSTPLWPEQISDSGQIGLVLMAIGLLLVIGLGRYAAHKKPLQEPPIAPIGNTE
ncbi:MAG: DUF368 domain-containing protein [Alphaproteobacteria bacterium]|nr:DUF368 domain-containing protein [Alphaproteobacteria bacterium]